MADVRAFRAYRPGAGLAERIAALPYDVYSASEAREEVRKEPLSFLAIDRPETQLPEGTDSSSREVYERAGSLLRQRIQEGSLVREKTACFYVYELQMDGRTQTGLVACASVEDYLNRVIKKHENTRVEKEEDRVRHVNACNAQTGPIFLAYRSRPELTAAINRARAGKCLYDFTAPDQVTHRVWRIEDETEIAYIQEAFRQVESVYIADGHHRCAAAVRAALERRKTCSCTGEEPWQYFLSVLFPDDQLQIMDYNRVVKDLNGMGEEEFLSRIRESFTVTEEARAFRPEKKGSFGMYLSGKWYSLREKDTASEMDAAPAGSPALTAERDPVESLDVSVLQKKLLEPVLGIRDPRTDERIDFVGGIRGLRELERRCSLDCKVAFSMYPTSIRELFSVADAGLLMPPKSTWFEPKLRSGLFIHSLESSKSHTEEPLCDSSH